MMLLIDMLVCILVQPVKRDHFDVSHTLIYFIANVALIALQAGLVFPDHSTMYETFAKKQINYLLGDSGRSFVVGFGINPPQRPYRRGR